MLARKFHIVTLAIFGLTLTVSGCGGTSSQQTPATNSTGGVPPSEGWFPATSSWGRLTNISNYAFTYQLHSGGQPMTISGAFASPSNYEIDYPTTKSRNIDGKQYDFNVGQGWKESTAINPANPLQEVTTQLIGILKMPGVKVTTTGSVTIAGESADAFAIQLGSAPMTQTDNVAIDPKTGALLQDKMAISSNSGSGTLVMSTDFEVTKIGSIPPFTTPKLVITK